MQFETIRDELEHIQKKNPEHLLVVDEVLAYAKRHRANSLVWARLPSREEAWEDQCKQIIRGLINVHFKVVATSSNNPIRAWYSEAREGERNYASTGDVLSDETRRQNLLLSQINRMLAIYNAYKLPELTEVAELLEALRARYGAPLEDKVA